MKAVNENDQLVDQQNKPTQTPAEFNEQLNLEFALIRVRTAALELMKLKLNILSELGETEEVNEAKKAVVANILKFPA